MTTPLTHPVDSSVLGARVRDGGTRFSLWAPRAHRVELALVDADRRQTNHDLTRNPDGVWTLFVPGVGDGQRYGYRVHGTWSPVTGERFNPAKLLVDPYARAITGGVDYSGPISDHTPESNYLPDPRDSFASVPLSVVVADTPPPRPLARRPRPEELVVYETHVKGYTQLHPAVPEHLRGTYGGMAYPAVVEHLTDLGVNAVEFLPVQHFVSEPFAVGRGLVNYWGYNTLGFFAPHAPYSSSGTVGEQVREFKEMVSALHDAGIAVILDVVYNHTAEGGHDGPTLSFRGIDHAGYYRLTSDLRNDYDVTGCGNAVDTAKDGVLDLVLDSLRYWVAEMGVDGFRFDLCTTLIRDSQHHVTQDHAFKQALAQDPVLSQAIMITEPWDLGPYGYQLGRWGRDWSEWNDRFRGFTRDFWRGAIHGVEELATRLAGSADIFDHDGRAATSSVNFVTAHDGFTLRDVVTYDLKHNESNGERNRDGADDNRSWNHGFEGETDDERINAARHRTMRNMTATLLLSTGMPMLLAGDEMGRTQQGNNNAYCQDSPISWVNWSQAEDWSDQWELTQTLLRLRAAHPVLRPARFRSRQEVIGEDGRGLGRTESAWFNEHGGEMTIADWHQGGRRALGMYLSDAREAFLVFVNAGDDLDVTLPGAPWATDYAIAAHTGAPDDFDRSRLAPGEVLAVPAQTVVVLQASVPSRRSTPLPSTTGV
ncbi:glycogen debranching protein GlgX [Propioniciclava coleopterorum]|uniref:Glycogen debranching protein GlgX n=1 Tax=Propioniciclava coleopterorum TaxID=2714937 RepID=A0A6G7YAI7_9ACTN|nr:glycogen debranching protein GlgX [Propioniciclava coleopterorum]QIK73627.1 glycogen debranching protein GlgX [Propioniciclava coleopterorum]